MPEPVVQGTPSPKGGGQVKLRRRRIMVSVLVILVAIPLVIVIGGRAARQSYYLTSVIVMALMMVPFFFAFESRRPQARELVTIAVLCALAIVGRTAFIWLPNVTFMTGIIMIAGVALGGEAGFVTGAVAVFASNFIFAQGPWTPWQMFAFGLAGLVAGFLADRGIIKREALGMRQRILWSVLAALFVIVIIGPLLDTCTLFLAAAEITPATAITIYAAGLPVNVIHGLSTGVAVFLLGNPLVEKVERLRRKYGLME